MNAHRRLQLALSPGIAVLYPIRAFPAFSSFPTFPHDFAWKSIDSDPLEGRVLLAELQKMTEGLGGLLRRNEQLARPSFQRLPAKLHFDLKAPRSSDSSPESRSTILRPRSTEGRIHVLRANRHGREETGRPLARLTLRRRPV